MTAPKPAPEDPPPHVTATCRRCGAHGITVGLGTKRLFAHREGEDMTSPWCADSGLNPNGGDYSREIAAWMDREKAIEAASKAQLGEK